MKTSPAFQASEKTNRNHVSSFLQLIPFILITGSNFCYGRLPVGIQSPKMTIESEVPSPNLVPVPKVKIKIGKGRIRTDAFQGLSLLTASLEKSRD